MVQRRISRPWTHRASSTPAACRPSSNRHRPAPCKLQLPSTATAQTAAPPKPSYANACTAAFVPRPALTYQLLGMSLTARGRIYLIKQVLEGQQPTRKTQQHLDRCLTCRNCESTCPSGVDYGHLIDIGRKLVDAKVPRPMTERAVRWALKEGIPSPCLARPWRWGRRCDPHARSLEGQGSTAPGGRGMACADPCAQVHACWRVAPNPP